MTDKPLNPSVDNSGAHGSALTPQQAARACIKRIEHHLLELMVPEGVANIEREFTEIISQVTPPNDLLGSFPGPVTHGGSAHHLSETQAEKRRAWAQASGFNAQLQAHLSQRNPPLMDCRTRGGSPASVAASPRNSRAALPSRDSGATA